MTYAGTGPALSAARADTVGTAPGEAPVSERWTVHSPPWHSPACARLRWYRQPARRHRWGRDGSAENVRSTTHVRADRSGHAERACEQQFARSANVVALGLRQSSSPPRASHMAHRHVCPSSVRLTFRRVGAAPPSSPLRAFIHYRIEGVHARGLRRIRRLRSSSLRDFGGRCSHPTAARVIESKSSPED